MLVTFALNKIIIIIILYVGSRDVINGEEYVNDYDGYDGPGDPKRPKPKKHKTKRSLRYLLVAIVHGVRS